MVALFLIMIDELGDSPACVVLEFVCIFGHDAVVEYLDLVGPAIPLADEMGAGRNGLCGSGVAWCPVRHGSQSAPGCGRKPAMGPALAFVQENAAQENARERAWRSSPKGLLPDPP